MSWFGALAGFGEGIVREADHQDRLERELALQRQRHSDKMEERAYMAQLMRERGAGSRSGGKDPELFDRVLAAATPEEQDRLAGAVRAFGGQHGARALMADVYGRPEMENVIQRLHPTPGDFSRFDRTLDESGQSDAAVPETVSREIQQRAQYDAQKGAQELQRLHAVLAGKFKDFSEGEGQSIVNDQVRGALSGGGDTQMRTARDAAFAVHAKERFKEHGGTIVDAAGVAQPSTTEVGRSQIAENQAQARKAAADAGNAGNRLIPVSPGAALVDPKTGQPVFVNPKAQGEKPLPSAVAKEILTNQANLRKAQNALALVSGQDVGEMKGDANATGWKGMVPNTILNRVDPKGVDARALLADLASMVIHDRSGAAVTAAEFPRLRPFIPHVMDDTETLKKKLQNFVTTYQDVINDQLEFNEAMGYTLPAGVLKKGGASGSWGDGDTSKPAATGGFRIIGVR